MRGAYDDETTRALRPARARMRCAAIAAGMFALLAGCGAPEVGPPNLLLIVVDTLRADHTSPYGYAAGATPRLAQLADEAQSP